jgi:hypothetical protein
MKPTVSLTVKVANIGRGVPTEVTRANLRRVRRRPPFAGPQAVLWQELDDDDRPPEWTILTDLYAPPSYRTQPTPGHPGQHVPITIPAPWKVVDHTSTKVSDGLAHVSPDRYVTELVATHPDLDDPIAFISFQLVAGAFTNTGQAAEAYRRKAWSEGFSGAKGIVYAAVLKGMTVIGGCDANNPRMPGIHPRAHVLVHRSLDYLWVVEGSTEVRVKRRGTIPLSIDGHSALFAKLDLRNKD